MVVEKISYYFIMRICLSFFSSSWDFFFRWDFCLILSRFGLSMSIVVAFRQQLSFWRWFFDVYLAMANTCLLISLFPFHK